MRALPYLLLLVACGSSRSPAQPDATPDAADAFVIPPGYDEWAQVCAKHHGDLISERFCAGSVPPPLGSISDLEALLDIKPDNAPLSMTGESTGLGMRSTTPINPRAILMRYGRLDPRFEVLSFARGEPLVELVADDPAAQTLRFFVVQIHSRATQHRAAASPRTS